MRSLRMEICNMWIGQSGMPETAVLHRTDFEVPGYKIFGSQAREVKFIMFSHKAVQYHYPAYLGLMSRLLTVEDWIRFLVCRQAIHTCKISRWNGVSTPSQSLRLQVRVRIKFCDVDAQT